MDNFCNELIGIIKTAFKEKLGFDVMFSINDVEIGSIKVTLGIETYIKNWKEIIESCIRTPIFDEHMRNFGLNIFTITLKEADKPTNYSKVNNQPSMFKIEFDCFSTHVLNEDETTETVKEALTIAFQVSINYLDY